ncbi:MAG: hypothetical protein Q8P50_07430 [Bacillota bacterium]|nr:hypothetical protein [Bacillota bacterium]
MDCQTNRGDEQLKSAVRADLERLLSLVKRDVEQRVRAREALKRLVQAWDRGDQDYLSRFLAGSTSRPLLETYRDAEVSLERLRLALARGADLAQEELEKQLANYCSAKGLRLEGRSGSFQVDTLLDVTLNLKKRAAKVGIQPLQSLDWSKIEAALDSERERLWGRPSDAAAIRDRLVAAYETVAALHPNPTRWVRLTDVYQEMKRRAEKEVPGWKKTRLRLNAYYRDEFCVDLSRLWSAQIAGPLDGQQIEFSAIRDPRLSFQIPLPDGTAASVGFMRPRQT